MRFILGFVLGYFMRGKKPLLKLLSLRLSSFVYSVASNRAQATCHIS